MATTDDSASWDLVADSSSDTALQTPRRSLDDYPHSDINEATSFADLVAVLQKSEEEGDGSKASAVQWLFRHAYYEANREALCDCGAVGALQHVLKTSDDYASQLYALFLVDLLDDDDEEDKQTREALVREPTPTDYARLFDAMDASASTGDRVVALETLFCLAAMRPSASELAGFVPRVVYQLRCRSPVGAAAALAVIKLAGENSALLIDHGVVTLLVDPLTTGERQHKDRALTALVTLLEVNSCAKLVAEKLQADNAIAPLVELVRSGVGVQRGSAASVLTELAGCGYDTAVGDAGAAQPLVDLARDGVGQEKCRAIFAIYAVGAGHDANWRRLAAAGVDVVLVDALRSTTHTHRSCAAHALAGLAHGNRTIPSAFGKAGVFEPLLECLRSGTDEEKEAAATAIAELVAKHDANKTVAVEAGVVLLLLAVMRDGSCEATAAKTLGSLAQKSALSKLRIVQAGALSPLVEILREGDNDAKREAANALRCIAKNNESYAVEIALLGALEALVANLSASTARGDEQGVWAVLRALRWLTECRTNQDALLALGVRDVLNDAEALGSRSQILVARVRNNLNLRGEKSTDDETCRIM